MEQTFLLFFGFDFLFVFNLMFCQLLNPCQDAHLIFHLCLFVKACADV